MNQIVEGVMYAMVREIGRVVGNELQRQWGEPNGGKNSPVICGPVEVKISKDGDRLEVHAFGYCVSSEICGKRLFYYSEIPASWSVVEFASWAEKVFEALEDVDMWAMRRKGWSGSVPKTTQFRNPVIRLTSTPEMQPK